ncbi:hypothetical protein TNCV_1323171 [Trichonephila clavipes]|nr:hypothetical protein TNCV_1323171 [Trichonephila clavipes]
MRPWYPCDHGHSLIAGMSRVRVPVPLKTCSVEKLMHVKSIEAIYSSVGVMWKFGEWVSAQISSSSFDHSSEL